MMDILDRDKMMDNVSIVSCSTQKSDVTMVTQNLEIPMLQKSTEKSQGRPVNTFSSLETSRETVYRRHTGGSDMSPLVPIQLTSFTQKSSGMEDTGSEMSEPLIPVISTKSSTITKKLNFEKQESLVIEESQSLLPNVPMESFTPYKQLQTNSGKCSNLGMSANKGNIRTNSTCNNDSPPAVNALASLDDVNLSQSLDYINEQGEFTLSQLEQTNWTVGEICCSQGTVTLSSNRKADPSDRIISRLDRLVSSLDKSSKRQKMVMEATILQCITSLQDCLNNKLKKRSSAADTSGILRKLLQTTQTGLLKLTEQHKLEKLQLSQFGTQSTQQTSSQLSQSAISDLGKRQRRMFSLLKRQKYLVDLYKTVKRPKAETDQTAAIKTDQMIWKTTRRQTSVSENTPQPSNDKKGRCKSGKTAERDTFNITATKTKKTVKDNGKFKAAVVQKKQEQFMRICTKETKLIKDVAFGGQMKVKDIEKGTEFGYSEDGVLSQDLTTIPDTQDCITQSSVRLDRKDVKSETDIVTTVGSYKVVPESGDSEIGKKINQQKKDTGVDIISRENKVNKGDLADVENMLDYVPLKRNLDVNIKTDKSIKKQKLNETEGEKTDKNYKGNNQNWNKKPENAKNEQMPPGIAKSSDQNVAKASEVLWLKMLHDDSNNEINNKQRKGPKDETAMKQLDNKKITDKQLVKEQASKKITVTLKEDRDKNKLDFQFIKPSLTPRKDLLEAENRREPLKEPVKAGKVSRENTDPTISKISKKNLESVNGRKILTTKEKEEEVVGLSSPPNVTIPGETWLNVSPTATSMSSDVFMVKVKDLQKRMKRRVELTQNISSDKYFPDKHLEKIDKSGQESGNRMSDTEQNLNKNNENPNACIGNMVNENDTVSEAIDAVIKQSRELSVRKDGFGERIETNTGNTVEIEEFEKYEENLRLLQEPKIKGQTRYSQGRGIPYGQVPLKEAQDKLKTATSKQQTAVGLPTLKELVQTGQLTPGKLVLSCSVEGKTHMASLTPLGRIRTPNGIMFLTASQWVSTLTDGEPVKKKKAYEMVQYKGRQLLSFCLHSHVPSDTIQPGNVLFDVSSTSGVVKMLTEQGTQVEECEISKLSTEMTEDEKELNSLLSSCVVRLLTEHDFVSSDDLPDNFWIEDFSKVRLHKDIWDCVDAW